MLDLLSRRLNLPTPEHVLDYSLATEKDVRLVMKRDDLIHPIICGNKWRKLKYYLRQASHQNYSSIASFGGAFSNHLIALAQAGKELGVPTIGFIRSYNTDIANPTINQMIELGMEVHFVHPDEYQLKEKSEQVITLLKNINSLLIPEGGSGEMSFEGVGEMMSELKGVYTDIITPIGSGGTAAGIVRSLKKEDIRITAIAPFKGSFDTLSGLDFLSSEERERLHIMNAIPPLRFAGYKPSIENYIHRFYSQHGIILDPIYTARMMMTIDTLLKKDYFSKGSQVLIIHTGGLQGIEGYNFRYDLDLPTPNDDYFS